MARAGLAQISAGGKIFRFLQILNLGLAIVQTFVSWGYAEFSESTYEQKSTVQIHWQSDLRLYPASLPAFQRRDPGGRRARVPRASGWGWTHDGLSRGGHEHRRTGTVPGRDDSPRQGASDHLYRGEP